MTCVIIRALKSGLISSNRPDRLWMPMALNLGHTVQSSEELYNLSCLDPALDKLVQHPEGGASILSSSDDSEARPELRTTNMEEGGFEAFLPGEGFCC